MSDLMINLDATAGNRAMWHNNKYPVNWGFMDKEMGLAIPPDVFCVWGYLPFRKSVFNCVLFDPPHDHFSLSSIHNDPKGWYNDRYENGRKIGGPFWGSLPRNKIKWVAQFHKAQQEFDRVTFSHGRLCLKWNETRHRLWNILPIFNRWEETHRHRYGSNMKRGGSKTYFVTFIKE